MITASHICATPLGDRKRRWTCPECGQLWRKVDGCWRLTEREPDAD